MIWLLNEEWVPRNFFSDRRARPGQDQKRVGERDGESSASLGGDPRSDL